jgi:hypothetical protein
MVMLIIALWSTRGIPPSVGKATTVYIRVRDTITDMGKKGKDIRIRPVMIKQRQRATGLRRSLSCRFWTSNSPVASGAAVVA